MAKYTFHKFTENVASVVKIEALASGTTLAAHELVKIAPAAVTGTITATVSDATPVAGDFLVWRDYPSSLINGDRYGRIAKTPIATGSGELYGFTLKVGDELIAAADGSLVVVGLPNYSLAGHTHS